nr:MAG TPA: hypothetical protein [Caudoviricetes sp.]
MGYEHDSSSISRRIVFSFTPNSSARLAIVSCLRMQSASKIAARRSLGLIVFTPPFASLSII